MGRTEIHYDNRTIFPNTVEITEKRAPTDDSVRLLNDMQDKAVSNIICKITNDTDNAFKWEAYFFNVISVDFLQAGILVLNLVVNGHKYEKKVKVKHDLMSKVGHGCKHYMDAEIEVRRFLFVQISLMVGAILLEDHENFGELMENLVSAGAGTFDKVLEDINE